MPIRVYNTLSKSKELFEPVVPGKVGIYLCGPTVYKPSHIGHMVGPVIFDAIKRYLVYSGYQATLVVNVTDVDDKLIAESKARGVTMAALAEEMTQDYMQNLAAMGVDTVDHFPRATQNMDEILSITQTLIDRGFAYASDGDVYFDVAKDAEYGKLSKRDVSAMLGDGGDAVDRKRSAADFALWKGAKPGEPSWPSPWGPGRPGWHIECSAMSRRLLGKTFDIHGGGLDLMFPHHENEIAQSECAHGAPQAKYWMHNGLMQASNEIGKVGGRATREMDAGDQAAQEAGKMGKSKGASAFRDLLAVHQPEAIRFFLLSTHYRRPIDFSEERIQEVARGLDQFYRCFKRLESILKQSFYDLAAPTTRAAGDSAAAPAATQEIRRHYLDVMDDDFNTGAGVADLFEMVRLINKQIDEHKLEAPGADAAKVAELRQTALVLKEIAGTLGLFRKPPTTASAADGEDQALLSKLMELLIDLRAEARKKKDFATGDRIRNSLGDLGIVLEDRPGGTQWTQSR